jgi:hypothetical protein
MKIDENHCGRPTKAHIGSDRDGKLPPLDEQKEGANDVEAKRVRTWSRVTLYDITNQQCNMKCLLSTMS